MQQVADYSIFTIRNLIVIFLIVPPLLRVFMLWRMIEAGFTPDIHVVEKLIPVVFLCGSVLFFSRRELVGESTLLFKLLVTLFSIAFYAGAILGVTESTRLFRGLVVENPYLIGGFLFSIALHAITQAKWRDPE